MKKLLILAVAFCFTQSPLIAETNDDSPAEKTELTHAEKKLQKKIKKAKKRMAALKKYRAKMKFKWCGNVKVALSTAKKANTTCLIVYSNPETCPYCVQLDNEVFKNKKFKAAKEIGVGVITAKPVPEYGLNQGMPSAVIVGPDGKVIGSKLGYMRNHDNLSAFLDALKAAQPTWDAMEAEIAALESGETTEGSEDESSEESNTPEE